MKPDCGKNAQPLIHSLADFDRQSGSLTERLLFNNRAIILILCVIVTVVLGYKASFLALNASFEKTIPTGHPFIANYLAHKDQLQGLGNAVSIAVETTEGIIYDAGYLGILQKISDELFLMPGVNRNFMKSLWTPSTCWSGVTEEGFEAGPVIPSTYNGSEQSVELVRRNVERSGEIGQIVAVNSKSSIIYVPLMSTDPETGKSLNYGLLSERLEALRKKHESDTIKIHITGFAKVMGDLIEGVRNIFAFFGAAIFVSAAVLFGYTRCVRSTLLVVICSILSVIWQLGFSTMLGYDLNPYSVLVPFLVFAIGMSHGAQKMNGIMQDIGQGIPRMVAARYTFRRLFLAGVTALMADAVGFAVLMIIRITVIRELATIASVGVACLVFTNLILLPIILSFIGVSPKAAERSVRVQDAELNGNNEHFLWRFFNLFTRPRWAAATITISVFLAVSGYVVSLDLKIGDLDPGAPELLADSRYNHDARFMTENYGASSDIFAIMVKTPTSACTLYDTLMRTDALEWELRQVEGVESTKSLALYNRQMLFAFNEGNIKWYELLRNQEMINSIAYPAPRTMYSEDCSMITLYVYLSDHKADTLGRVVDTVETFARNNNTENAEFLLAAGSAGISAATNMVVKKANREMLFWVYAAVIVLCFITFRSWRAVICAILPLVLTSILAEALMVWLKIGVKVATLPVIALGVGIGVDYALYLLSMVMVNLNFGETLADAYRKALLFTGKIVVLIGVTLSVSVATWVFSPIKFQADMGILLSFMFLWNMLGTLLLLPALAFFLMPRRNVYHGKTVRESKSVVAFT